MNLPESTVAAIFLMCLDTSFSVAYPIIHESAVAYLEQACLERYNLYRRVSRASYCMEATCTFLKEAQAEVIIRTIFICWAQFQILFKNKSVIIF